MSPDPASHDSTGHELGKNVTPLDKVTDKGPRLHELHTELYP